MLRVSALVRHLQLPPSALLQPIAAGPASLYFDLIFKNVEDLTGSRGRSPLTEIRLSTSVAFPSSHGFVLRSAIRRETEK
jgi:hypothetical protein